MARKTPQRIRMGGTKATPKVEEKRLLRSIRALKEDPLRLIPSCHRPEHRCNFCPYPKLIRRLETVRAVDRADNEKKLTKYAKGNDMAAAYAGALLLERSGEAPRLAMAPFPTGKVAYAVRGRAAKEKHISVQHWNEPVWRVLGHRDLVRRKGLFLFDLNHSLVCTARKPHYPLKLLAERAKALKRDLQAKGDHYLSSDLEPEDLESDPRPPGLYLQINTKEGPRWVGLSEPTIRSSRNGGKTNSYHHFLDPCATKKSLKLMTVHAEGGLHQDPGAGTELPKVETARLFRDYREGRLGDGELLKRLKGDQLDLLKAAGEPGLVLDHTYYGQAYDAALEDLGLEQGVPERLALEVMLNDLEEPLILNDPTVARLLNELWPAHGRKGLQALLGDTLEPSRLKELNDRFDTKNALDLVRQAVELKEAETLLADLPRYRNLPAPAVVADTMARLNRTRGAQGAFRYLDKVSRREPAVKAVTWASLLVLDRAKGQEWRFSKEERDFGEVLQEYAGALLEKEGDDYHRALQTLLAATGSTTSIKPMS